MYHNIEAEFTHNGPKNNEKQITTVRSPILSDDKIEQQPKKHIRTNESDFKKHIRTNQSNFMKILQSGVTCQCKNKNNEK